MEDLGHFPMLSSVAMLFVLLLVGLWSFTYILRKDTSSQLPPCPLGLPFIGHLHLLGDLPHRTLHKLSQKYGPIMQLRLGFVPAVVISTPEAAELFLKTHDVTFASRAKTQASEYLGYGSKGLGSSEYGPSWRNIRRLCTIHLLSISKVDSFRPLRKQEVWNLVKNLKRAAEFHEVVNISGQVGVVIEKIVYQMIGGSGKKEMPNLKASIEELFRLAGIFNIADFLPFMKVFDLQGLNRRMKDVAKIMDDVLEHIIHEHEEDTIGQQEHHRDFIDVMLSLMKSDNIHEEKLDRINIKALTLDMLAASMDTTSTAIEWALTELLRHPQVMKQVQGELENVVGLDRMVEESDLTNLAYLNMVVKETMRLHPVAPLLLPHESIEDISIYGYHIPRRSRILINAWAIGRDPNAWPDNPEEFYPERFINTTIDVRGHDLQLIPFGSGRRKCPGIELGLRTIHFVLAQLVHCFNLELPDGMSPKDVDVKERFGITVPRANPLLVVPTYRLMVHNI